jgi:hypothetical protein
VLLQYLLLPLEEAGIGVQIVMRAGFLAVVAAAAGLWPTKTTFQLLPVIPIQCLLGQAVFHVLLVGL